MLGKTINSICLSLLLTLSPLLSSIFVPTTQADTFPQLISVASDETQGDADSGANSNTISADGRYVAFESDASNLIPNDTNEQQDIFVRDRVLGTIERISITSDGTEANNGSQTPFISANGRYVVFNSAASNLVPNDTNNRPDVFIHDLVNNTTERVNLTSTGSQGNGGGTYPSISADGQFVVFASNGLTPNDTFGIGHVYVRDRVTNTTIRVSSNSNGDEANGHSASQYANISADGRYVAFTSQATNLVSNDTNGLSDIFVRDLVSGTTERVNVANDSSEANDLSRQGVISADGRYVAFLSSASNLVFGGTSGEEHIFVHDRVTGQTLLASISSNGEEANSWSYHPSLSGDGRYVTFESDATNLVPDDTNDTADVFVHDILTGTTARVSVASDGNEGNSESYDATLSLDGRYVVHGSCSSNFVPNDTNDFCDSFISLNPLFVSTNQAPVLDSIGDKTINENTLLQFTISATDPDADTLTYSAANLPPGATFDPESATFSWTPGYNQAGNYPNIEFTVIDDGSPMELDVELITITVGNVNRAPEFDPIGPHEVLENEPLTFTVSATDPDNDSFILSATNLPQGSSFDPQTGNFLWTPTLTQAGIYVITFEATDDGIPVEIGSTDVVITVGDSPTPTEQAENLVDSVIEYDFPTNIENAYLSNLKKIEKFIEEGKIQAAINQLHAFIDKVENDYAAAVITQSEYEDLINFAETLLADLQ